MLYPSGPPWSTQEDLILAQSYGQMPVKAILGANPALSGRSPHALYQRANKLGLKSPIKHRLHHTIRLDFFKVPTIESAYWAGFLAADGCLVKDPNKPNTYRLCLSLAVKDEAHVRLFQKTMGHTGEVGYIHHEARDWDGYPMKAFSTCFVNICQAGRFVDDLARLGLIPDKTKRLPPPQLESDLLRLAYLRGYIDGDGCLAVCDCVDGERFNIGIVSSCQSILEWIKQLVDRVFPISYRGTTTSVNRSTSSDVWDYKVNGHRALRIVHILSRIPTPELARKWRQPRLLAMIEASQLSHPSIWSTRLPIEDEIDRFLHNPTPILCNSPCQGNPVLTEP